MNNVSKFCSLPLVFGDLPRLPVVVLHLAAQRQSGYTLFDAVPTKIILLQQMLEDDEKHLAIIDFLTQIDSLM